MLFLRGQQMLLEKKYLSPTKAMLGLGDMMIAQERKPLRLWAGSLLSEDNSAISGIWRSA
jgi:hypothetical protein